MTDSTPWLAISLGLVAVSLTAVFVVALPAVIELGRAARSAEKLFDTLNRELPPLLNAMQATGEELGELTEEVGDSVEKAGRLVQQVDQGVSFVKQQAVQAKRTGRSLTAGARAAWAVLSEGYTPPAETVRRSVAPLSNSAHSAKAPPPSSSRGTKAAEPEAASEAASAEAQIEVP